MVEKPLVGECKTHECHGDNKPGAAEVMSDGRERQPESEAVSTPRMPSKQRSEAGCLTKEHQRE